MIFDVILYRAGSYKFLKFSRNFSHHPLISLNFSFFTFKERAAKPKEEFAKLSLVAAMAEVKLAACEKAVAENQPK